MSSLTTTGARASSDAVVILARLWCRAEGNDPEDTISDAGHTVLDAVLSGQDRKALAAIRQAEADLRAALASPPPVVVPDEVRRLSEIIASSEPQSSAQDFEAVRDYAERVGHERFGRVATDAMMLARLHALARPYLAATPTGRAGDVHTPPAGGGAVDGEGPADHIELVRQLGQRLAEQQALSGYVCIDPEGKPFWPSARATREESLRICFGAYNEVHLRDCFGKGWTCRALATAPTAPESAAVGRRAVNMVADQIWAALRALETPERAGGVEDAEAAAQVLGHAVDTAKSILRAALRSRDREDGSREDQAFAVAYTDARGRLDYEHMARVLSGRLRRMDRRSAAANRRADRVEQELRLMRLRAEGAERARDARCAVLSHQGEGSDAP